MDRAVSLNPEVIRTSPPSVVRNAGLRGILKPGANGYLLRRPLPRALARAIEGLEGIEPFERKVRLAHTTDVPWLLEPLGAAVAQELCVDMTRWVEQFRALGDDQPICASLVLTRTDDCRKFHVDWVGLRLICTYLGPGTEWAPDAGVYRPALAMPWHSIQAINRAIVPDVTHIVRAAAGDVLLLKGESFPGNSGRGAVHRSPPIAERDGVRLLFKLTSPTDHQGRSAARETGRA
jgi:hypothetical protein